MPTRKKTTGVTTKKAAVRKSVENTTSPSLQKNIRTYARNPRLWVGVGVVVIVVLLFLFKGLFIAATVNGQPISRLSVVSQLEKQNGKQALSGLVVQTLVKQEAQKRHISVTQSDIDAQIKKIEDQLKGQGVTLDDALASQGMTRADLNDQLQLQTLVEKMVGTTSAVSDADVQKYIDDNKSSLPTNLSDSQLQAQVRSQLAQQNMQQEEQTFIANLQKQAKITYFVNY